MSKENDQFNEENPIDYVRSIRLKNNEKFKEMLKTKKCLKK